jgi:hypothetical protein
MTRTIFIAAAFALAATLPIAPAQALVARTFLSAAGSDSNNCANVLTPCRHLATAYAATAPDGEIYVLDPANYGSLTITHGVSIEGHGWASIAPVAGQAAITINALGATDKINIIGVVLDGTAITNTTGIQFNSGGSLTVQDSVIRNFTQSGIFFQPSASSSLFVADTLLTDNGFGGVQIHPSGSGTVTVDFNRVEVKNNNNLGIEINAGLSSGGSITANVSESNISGNGSGIGVTSFMGEAVAKVTLFHSVVANSPQTGIASSGTTATVTVAQSVVTGNVFAGWDISLGGALQTYQDNYITGNGANVGTPTNVGKL